MSTEPVVHFSMSVSQARLVMAALAELPFKVSAETWSRLNDQLQDQLAGTTRPQLVKDEPVKAD